mgnify:CR=1 FL=1
MNGWISKWFLAQEARSLVAAAEVQLTLAITAGDKTRADRLRQIITDKEPKA